MSIMDAMTKTVYKWVVLYPGFRRFVNWAYSDLLKMPQYHIALAPGQIGEYVLLVDDPASVPIVAAKLDHAEEIACHREYRTFTGILDGVRVSVTSTGLGGPPAAIAVHELAAVGASTYIFLGAGLSPKSPLKPGQFIIPVGAVREEGTGLQYAPLAFPALADPRVADALRQACQTHYSRVHIGLVRSVDAYLDFVRSESGKSLEQTGESLPGVLCSDLNTAAILIVASILKKHAAALLLAADKDEKPTAEQIAIALDALRLIMADRSKPY